MTAAAEPASASAAKLHAALLEYFSAPGKYQLTLRQPALLFASIREILQIAAGRGQLEDLPESQAGRLREAAGFFVRAALLYPGADHYAVFGLTPRAEPVELKERYRLLMRLTHPDFASEATAGWPDDAATRVNRAYEILSSPVLRRDYDEQLAPAPRPGRAGEPAKAERGYAVQQARRVEKRAWKLNRTAAWALALGLGLLLVVFLFPPPETGHLVQKTPASPARTWAQDVAAGRASSAAATALRPAELLAAAPATEVIAPAAPVPSATEVPTVAAAPAPAPTQAPAPAAAPAAPPASTRPTNQTPALRSQPPQAPAPTVPQSVPVPSAAELAAEHRRSQAAAFPEPMPPPVTPRKPESVPPAVFPPAPVVAAAPPAAAVPVPPVPTRAAAPAAAAPSLNDAQPLLTQMLQQLESGSGDQLLRLLEVEGRQAPSAQALSRHYEQLVRGARPVRLSQVEFRSEARDGVLLVTGRIRLHAGEPTIGSHGERLMVRAEFVSRGGKVLLTGLSGAPD
jgi:hypothetical protein